MVCQLILKVKKFPKTLTNEEIEDFLKHFGAVDVQVIRSKAKERSIAFARFDTKQIAKSVLQRIHQINVLGSYLSAEYATTDIGYSDVKRKLAENNENKSKNHYKTFISKINSFNSSLAFNQPPPSHLKYNYPKPNPMTINNIAKALNSIPKFYTQVLHLMNRMNLPPPFVNYKPVPVQISSPIIAEPSISIPTNNPCIEQEKESTDESEIESDNENTEKLVIPLKRKLGSRKIVKRPKFMKPNILPSTQKIHSTKEKLDKVFETVDLQQQKIELKLSTTCLLDKIVNTDESAAKKSESTIQENAAARKLDEAEKVTEDLNKEVPEKLAFISDQELSTNRIPVKDLPVLAVFKDYTPGTPSSRLYIKNIAKAVNHEDLEYIYKRYERESDESTFNIRLMKEGRMKGQAFISLDTVELAKKALEDTNGFILKDKPLVVVFARSALTNNQTK